MRSEIFQQSWDIRCTVQRQCSLQNMAEIELTGIRSRDPDRPTLDSSHEGLLSAENPDGVVANGNGHIHPESEAFLGGNLEKPPSVSVFRKPRRKWWILVLIIFIVAILLVAIFLGVFFAVSEGNAMSPKPWFNSTTINTSLVTPPPEDEVQKPVSELHIQQFQSFRDSGNSKIFEVTFSNGTILRTFGHKGIDGAFHSLYSISVGDAKGSDLTRVHFKGQNNFASVMLPQGTIVTYDSTDGFKSLECKIFSVPKTGSNTAVPVSHIVTLPLGEYSDVFVRISKGLIKPHVQHRTNVSRAECNSRLPLKVTKCGNQYPYQGSFIQGSLTPQETGPQVTMEALPWPTTQDNCPGGRTSVPNYFLPLPVHTNITSERMMESFCSSGTSVFHNLCLSIEGSDTNLDSEICRDVARAVKDERSELYEHIYGSCFKIFHSIRLTCVALKVSSSRDVNTNEFQLSQEEIYKSLCKNSSSTSDVLKGPHLYVEVIAYCPSVLPQRSYRQLIHLNQSNLNTFENQIQINCPNSPEVTRYVLGHKYIGTSSSRLDRIDHLLHVCSTCADDRVMEVEVSRDDTCCYNNCSRSEICESSPHVARHETKEFVYKTDFYCYEFLKDYENKMHSEVETGCISGCKMKLSVEFKLYSKDKSQMFYHQTLTCEEDNSLSCRRTFGR